MHPRTFLVAAALILVGIAAGCGSGAADDNHDHETTGRPVGGLVARLSDEVRPRPGNRIGWSTYWTLCWKGYPGATAYELETLTGEGASPRLRRQLRRCLRIEAASGESERLQRLRNRRILLALQAGQLAYRVRAVLDDDRVSPWSRAIAVGTTRS